MYIIYLLIFSSVLLANQNPKLPEAVRKLDQECNQGNGLSCAKAAYLTKRIDASLAFDYYRKGCDLNDETACYNMKSLNPKSAYDRKAEAAISFYTTHISNCYIPNLANKTSHTQLKEVWHQVNIKIHINHQGQGAAKTVTSRLPSSFSDCVKKVVAQIQFPTSDVNEVHRFDYTLTIRAYE